MIIHDVHCHIFPDKLAEKAAHSIGDFYGVPITRPASVSQVLAEQEKAGVSRSVVSNSAVTPQQVHNINTFIAEACRENPQFIGFGSIFPGMEGWETELERMQALGLRGIKIHPDFQHVNIDEPSAVEMYRAAARAGLVVQFHMGDNRYDYSSQERLLNLLRQVPDLRVIAAHFGGWNVWEQAGRYTMPENVVYDSSSTTPMTDRDTVLRLIDYVTPRRLLFGSDFPMWSPAEEVQRMLTMDLSREEQEMVFHKNFEKFFVLDG